MMCALEFFSVLSEIRGEKEYGCDCKVTCTNNVNEDVWNWGTHRVPSLSATNVGVAIRGLRRSFLI